ncbi:outer membrane lipoprotein LolB [Moraxella lincolnii]|uniref:outer membrane lipoprotein LolB n=1 Tax=Lwoffella lincolnii TaxID=90241 RepID=UPI000991DA72|nr:outer membrane lipoprotein LolB [Moraxella lincolnii]
MRINHPDPSVRPDSRTQLAPCKHRTSIALSAVLSASWLVGCQSTPNTTASNMPAQTVSDIKASEIKASEITASDMTPLTPIKPDKFALLGKIGMVNTSNNQAGSAFYAWGQEQDRFTIELQGALGLGLTTITYNGSTAMLKNARIGTMTAPTPEALLLQATNWQAPISHLPYWLSGSPAPSDTTQHQDEHGRLTQAVNGEWTAHFTYPNDVKHHHDTRLDGYPYALPNQITATHANGSKLTMSIRHQ